MDRSTRQRASGVAVPPASTWAIAERIGAVRVYTLDVRHFGLIRPIHADRFDVKP